VTAVIGISLLWPVEFENKIISALLYMV